MTNYALNLKDQQLIDILKLNARMSVSEIAKKLNVSRTTIQHRMNRLEQTGLIKGYTVRVGETLSQSKLTAYISLTIDPNTSNQIVGALKRFSSIETLLTVSGKIDLIVVMSVHSTTELDEQIDKIGEIVGIKSTETSIVLATKIDRR